MATRTRKPESFSAATAADAARGADVIVTTTPAESPILNAADVAPGTHVTAMGSDAEHKNEIDPALIALATYAADRLAQTRRLGEWHHAIAAGLVAALAGAEEVGEDDGGDEHHAEGLGEEGQCGDDAQRERCLSSLIEDGLVDPLDDELFALPGHR